MNAIDNKRVCPVERAGTLDVSIRKLLHNPGKILSPYISEGMTVLDMGCGPGYFTMEIAKLVGNNGKVIAADLQDGMLEKVKVKIKNSRLESVIKLYKCQNDKIGLTEKVDFVLVFYMLHEVPDQNNFIREIKTLLSPDGKVLIVEPKFHVSNGNFRKSMHIIEQNGFRIIEKPKVLFSRTLLLEIIR